MAALVILMSGMTVAEAAECASDIQPSAFQTEAALDASPSETPDNTVEQEHGVCPHGHCHNSNNSTAASFDDKIAISLNTSLQKPQSDTIALSSNTSRLKRPPRA